MSNSELKENIAILAAAITESSLRRKLERRNKSFKEARPNEELPDVWRMPETTHGVMTKEQILAQYANPNEDEALICCGLSIHSNGKAFFLSDDGCLGYQVIPGFTAVTFGNLHRCISPTGNYKSLDEFIERHGHDEIHLTTVEEIATYVLTGSKEPVV